MKKIFPVVFIFFCFSFFSCSNFFENETTTLSVSLPSKSQRALVTKSEFDNFSDSYYKIKVTDFQKKIQEKKASISESLIKFDNIAVGNCAIEINAYMGNLLVAQGQNTAEIRQNEVTNVSISLSKITVKPSIKL